MPPRQKASTGNGSARGDAQGSKGRGKTWMVQEIAACYGALLAGNDSVQAKGTGDAMDIMRNEYPVQLDLILEEYGRKYRLE